MLPTMVGWGNTERHVWSKGGPGEKGPGHSHNRGKFSIGNKTTQPGGGVELVRKKKKEGTRRGGGENRTPCQGQMWKSSGKLPSARWKSSEEIEVMNQIYI